jgi:hypothetical protein
MVRVAVLLRYPPQRCRATFSVRKDSDATAMSGLLCCFETGMPEAILQLWG